MSGSETQVVPMPSRTGEAENVPDELRADITADDLAAAWGVDRTKVYRIPPEDLPYYKLGPQTRRYRPQDVRAYLERQRHDSEQGGE